MSGDFQTTEYGKISVSFSKASLAKLCVEKIGVQTGPFGSQLHNKDYVVIGTPIITVEHLGDNRITYQNMPCVSDDDKVRLFKYCIQEGDIVFSRVGSVDRRALVRQEEDGWLFSGRCLRVRVDKTKIDSVYLSYFFGLESFKNYIKSIAVGATMPSINTKILSNVPIYYPNLRYQKKMGEILQKFDDKIHINRQINQTLESMAQAIFKSWFVNFDPVKAKIAALESGEDAEGVTRAAMRAISGKTDDELDKMEGGQPEDYAKLKTTAGLFPAAMQDSELGEVPEGWVVVPFSKLANLDTTSVKPHNELGKLWEHYSIPAFDVNESPNFELGSEIKSNKYKVNPTAILSSKLNPNTPRTWWPDVEDETSAICSTEFMQFVPTDEAQRAFMFGLITSEIFQSGIKQRVTGSTGSRQRAQPSAVAEIDIVKPNEELILTYCSRLTELSVLKAKNIKENITLAQLRDTLLPKLMSGDILVKTER